MKSSTLDEETIESAASSDGMRERDLASDTLNDEVTSRYREAFQARPDEYEHEFNDEEYLRPRPRKRRPPQNYEFALANEASDEENEESRDPEARPSSQKESEDLSTTTPSSDSERKNALELKSLLKMQQQEGSSLLEILQRKNLTLSDLLKGKSDVINALKSRMADESDEYVEEMSRVMSNSLMKLAATATLPWRPAQTTTAPEKTTTRTGAAAPSDPDNAISKTTVVPESTSESRVAAGLKDESAKDVERTRQSARRDFPRLRATTPAIVTTVITTSASPPAAMSSMEYLLNDDGIAESTSDRATKLDEDEIMEFSDFTDFTKKGKDPTASSTWSSPPGETTGLARDTVSTLSIERILNPTERSTELTKDRENAEKVIWNSDRSIPTGEPSAEDYNTFVETEYQNDAPDIPQDIPENNIGRMGDDSSANSADDGRETPRDKNHSSEYHQVDDAARDREDHRRRYEDVVSEIEPEARAEIFELFASGSAGRRLERLLKSRNMSVEELIALRQRGSSRVHLTEVSRLKVSRIPPTLGTSNANKGETVIPFSKDSHEQFGARIKTLEKEGAKQEAGRPTNQFKDIMSYLHNPFLDKDAANMSLSRLLNLAERDRDASRGAASSEDKQKPENSDPTIVNLLAPFDSFAKDLQQQFEAEEEARGKESKASNDTSTMLIDEGRKTVAPDNSSELHAGYVEEIAKGIAPNTIEIRTIYDETASRASGGDERKTLSRMRPSIIASGAILGVAIVVFLAIFIVCRIRQKQRYTYRNTFSRAVFQGPVMAARKLSNSSSLSTVMVNVVATSTAKRPERMETQEVAEEFDGKCDMDNDSLDANDSWETIPDYAK